MKVVRLTLIEVGRKGWWANLVWILKEKVGDATLIEYEREGWWANLDWIWKRRTNLWEFIYKLSFLFLLQSSISQTLREFIREKNISPCLWVIFCKEESLEPWKIITVSKKSSFSILSCLYIFFMFNLLCDYILFFIMN